MIALDYLFYYLTYWFEKNKDKLSWSTPLQRSSYAVGLATIALIYSLSQIAEYTILKGKSFQFPKLLFVLLALGIMWLYDYIYIKRDRYQIICSKFNDTNKNKGVVFSIIILVLLIMSPFIIITIFVPFGGQALKH